MALDTSYRLLQEHLDLLTGFPKTESGIEIAILKKIFTAEEAEMAIKLGPKPESIDTFCKRTDIEFAKAEEMLEEMAKKGQIFRMRIPDGVHYSASPFAPGIYEYQLNTIDLELAEMMEVFFNETSEEIVTSNDTQVFRILPVDENISNKMEIMPYDRIKELIRAQRSIAVADCICRKEKRIVGEECKHMDEVCLVFSHMAKYYVENGMARFITVDEAVEVLDKSEKDGLVHSPQNAQRPMAICNCCGCCCGILRGITELNIDASKVIRSDFYAVCDAELCSGCEECLERCHVNAITMVDEIADIKREQCIGCGLCVTTCPTESLKLVRKPSEELFEPPTSMGEVFIRMASEKAQLRESK